MTTTNANEAKTIQTKKKAPYTRPEVLRQESVEGVTLFSGGLGGVGGP